MNIKKMFIEDVFAHCDVPCGIYDPRPAQIAAATVLKMVQKIQELDQNDQSVNNRNTMIRCVLTKEEHARKCKEEILILWTDFFKPEDLAAHSDLHDMIWKTTKLVSKNKQEVNLDAAKELVSAVDQIAHLFQAVTEERAKK